MTKTIVTNSGQMVTAKWEAIVQLHAISDDKGLYDSITCTVLVHWAMHFIRHMAVGLRGRKRPLRYQWLPVSRSVHEGRHKGNGGFRESHSKKEQKGRTKKQDTIYVHTYLPNDSMEKALFCLIAYLVLGLHKY